MTLYIALEHLRGDGEDEGVQNVLSLKVHCVKFECVEEQLKEMIYDLLDPYLDANFTISVAGHCMKRKEVYFFSNGRSHVISFSVYQNVTQLTKLDSSVSIQFNQCQLFLFVHLL